MITPLDPERYVRTPWKNGGGVTVDPAPGTPLNDAVGRASALLNGGDDDEGILPRNSPYTYVLSGQAKTLAETGYGRSADPGA